MLKFGDFTLKSGRKSPFFMNAGAYVTGSQLKRLGEYLSLIHISFRRGPKELVEMSEYFGEQCRSRGLTHSVRDSFYNCLLYTSRPVVYRDGNIIMVDDDRMKLRPGEKIQMKSVRFRTLGCYPLTGGVESTADTLDEIIDEDVYKRQLLIIALIILFARNIVEHKFKKLH